MNYEPREGSASAPPSWLQAVLSLQETPEETKLSSCCSSPCTPVPPAGSTQHCGRTTARFGSQDVLQPLSSNPSMGSDTSHSPAPHPT